jgi:hypothetical protein
MFSCQASTVVFCVCCCPYRRSFYLQLWKLWEFISGGEKTMRDGRWFLGRAEEGWLEEGKLGREKHNQSGISGFVTFSGAIAIYPKPAQYC